METIYARIEIGGTVTEAQAERLLDLLKMEGLSPASAHEKMPLTAQGLGRMAAYAVWKTLMFEDSCAAWGRFEMLEDYLFEQGIPFVRYTAAHQDAAYRVIFTGEGEPREEMMIGERPVCDYPYRDSMAEVLDLLKAGSVAQGVALLERNIGVMTKDLPPFTISNNG